ARGPPRRPPQDQGSGARRQEGRAERRQRRRLPKPESEGRGPRLRVYDDGSEGPSLRRSERRRVRRRRVDEENAARRRLLTADESGPAVRRSFDQRQEQGAARR